MDKHKFRYYAIFILILISSQKILLSSTEIDRTKLGVSIGDEFTITIVKLKGTYLDRYQILNNITEGQVVKYLIYDTTIYYGDTFFIHKVLNSQNDTIPEIVQLDELGELIIYADWDFWRVNAVVQLLELYPELTEDLVNISETKDIFRVIINISSTSSFLIIEYIYDKTTGIANRLRIEFEVLNENGFAEGSFIFDRFPIRGESEETNNDNFIIILSGFLILVVILRLLSNKNWNFKKK